MQNRALHKSSTKMMQFNLQNNNENFINILLSESQTIQKVSSIYNYAKAIKNNKTQFNQKQFEADLRRIIFDGNKPLSSLSVANLWGALALCNYNRGSLKPIPTDILENLLKTTHDICANCKKDDISRIFSSLIYLKVNFDHQDVNIPRGLLKEILKSLSNNTPDMNHIEICLVFPAFVQLCDVMGYAEQLQDDNQFWINLCCDFLTAIERNANQFTIDEQLKILVNYKIMKKYWGKLPELDYNHHFLHGIASSLGQMSDDEFIQTLQLLAHLNAHWSNLPNELATALMREMENRFETLDQAAIAKSLWVLVRLSVSLESNQSLRSCIVTSVTKNLATMELVDLSISCWALGVLHIEWDEIDPSRLILPLIKQNIETNLDQFKPEGINQLHQANLYFKWNLGDSFIDKVKDVVPGTLQITDSRWEKKVTNRIQRLLKGMGIEMNSEYLIESFKHVDIYFPEFKAALELDSDEVHYDKQNQLRSKDVFNESVLKNCDYQLERLLERELNLEDKKSKHHGDHYILQKLEKLKIINYNPELNSIEKCPILHLKNAETKNVKLEISSDGKNSVKKKKHKKKNKNNIIQNDKSIEMKSPDLNDNQSPMNDGFQIVGKNNKIVQNQEENAQAKCSKKGLFALSIVSISVAVGVATTYTKLSHGN